MKKGTRVNTRCCYALTGLLLIGISVVGQWQAASAGTAPVAPAPAAQPEYHPSMGDLMTMAVQPRHTKLASAGNDGNWPYAAYELSELRNAFARIARTIPQYQSMDTAALVTAMTKGPLDELDEAIKASDKAQFVVAYARLTQACNACHQSQSHAFVVIKVPETSMFPDQDFRPASR